MEIAGLFGIPEEPARCEWCHKEHAGICDEMQTEATRRTIASPDLDQMRKYLLMNLTTKPDGGTAATALMWMQLEPSKWKGYNSRQCVGVSRMLSEMVN